MRRGLSYLLSTEDRVWLGYTLQHGDLLPSVISEGRKIGKRPRGRPRMGMLDRVKDGDP